MPDFSGRKIHEDPTKNKDELLSGCSALHFVSVPGLKHNIKPCAWPATAAYHPLA